jgi:hypothetical protein
MLSGQSRIVKTLSFAGFGQARITMALIMAMSKAFPMPAAHTSSIIFGLSTNGLLLRRERRAQEASHKTSCGNQKDRFEM